MVVISEMIDPIGLERLEQASLPIHYDPALWQSSEKLSWWVSHADALVVRNQTAVTAELLESASSLQVVGRLGVGLDNIDVAFAQARQIPVVTAKGANAVAVAEYVFACLLHFSRNVSTVADTVRRGVWDRSLGGTELFGKTLGLIGLGDIAQRVMLRALSFGMQVIAYDPWQLSTRMATMELGVALVSFQELLTSSDFISLHVPLNPQTTKLLDAKALAQVRPSAHLINTSRGGVVDEDALLAAIRRGELAGAALDVRQQEPPVADDLLKDQSRILSTPHIAGLTQEASRRTALMVVEDVIRVLSGQPPLSSV